MAMGTVIPEIHRLSNLSVYSWMEGAAVATTTAVAPVGVAGLATQGRSGHSSGSTACASLQVQLLSGRLPARLPLWPLGLDHPGPLRDRGGRRAVWWFTDSTAKLNPS